MVISHDTLQLALLDGPSANIDADAHVTILVPSTTALRDPSDAIQDISLIVSGY